MPSPVERAAEQRRAQRPLPPGTWEFAIPEGTPLDVLPRSAWTPPYDPERARLRAMSDHFEDDGQNLLPTVVPTLARRPAPGLTTEEARIMAAPVEAPLGYKADGKTPRKRRASRKPAISPQEARRVLTFDKLLGDTKDELDRLDREVSIQAGVAEAEQRKLAEVTGRRDRVRRAYDALTKAEKAA